MNSFPRFFQFVVYSFSNFIICLTGMILTTLPFPTWSSHPPLVLGNVSFKLTSLILSAIEIFSSLVGFALTLNKESIWFDSFTNFSNVESFSVTKRIK